MVARRHGTSRCLHARDLTITADCVRLEWRAGAAVVLWWTGAPWRDLPDEFGKWYNVYTRF
jgi:hypothetical protein